MLFVITFEKKRVVKNGQNLFKRKPMTFYIPFVFIGIPFKPAVITYLCHSDLNP